MEWQADYLKEAEQPNQYGDYSMQEVLAIAMLASTRRQVTDAGLTNLTAFDGRHRSGKSLTALTIAYLWDPTFWPYFESRLVQEPKQFMNALETIDKDKIKNPVIQVDEAGVSMASSEWYERWMKTLAKTVQMFGYLHPTVFFVAPIKDFVDSRLRKMFHAYYNISRFNADYSVLTPYNVHYSTIKNKWYYKKPIVKYGGQNIRVEKIRVSKPPAFLVERYMEYEKGIKGKMLEGFIADIRADEEKEVLKEKDLEAIIKWVVANYTIFQTRTSSADNIILDKPVVQYKFKLSTNESQYVKNQAERLLRTVSDATAKEIADIPQFKAKARKIGGGMPEMGSNSQVFG